MVDIRSYWKPWLRHTISTHVVRKTIMKHLFVPDNYKYLTKKPTFPLRILQLLTLLESSRVKRTHQDSIFGIIIGKLHESIGSCWFQIHLCNPACIMSSEFLSKVDNFLRNQISFVKFDVNVFKAILSIQRFFNLTEDREVIAKIHCSLGMQECRLEFDWYSLLIMHAGLQIWIWYWLWQPLLRDSFFK